MGYPGVCNNYWESMQVTRDMNSAVKNLFTRNRRVESSSSQRDFRPQSGPYVSAALSPASPVAVKPRYRVDLSGQQADCEANYYRLRKLLSELSSRDNWLFNIGSGNVESQLSITVVDRAPYTTTLELSQTYGAVSKALQAPRLTVCMYHDADMAEVVAWEKHRRLQARYDYPNRQMYHADEKAQLNRFLADWLTLCQAEGHVAVDLADLGLR